MAQHKKVASFVALACALGLLAPRQVSADDAPPGRKLAFLVGVKTYDHADLKNLDFPENDVEELAAVLKREGFQGTVLTTQRGRKNPHAMPTAENIRTSLASLLKGTTKHDLILVALAGHGLQPVGATDSYFCPCDAVPIIKDDRPIEPKRLISLGEILAQMSDSGIGRKLLLVDACRNDPSARNVHSFRHRGVDRVNLNVLPSQTAMLLSCSEGEFSFEDKSLGGGHGVFFYHIIEGLRGAARGDDNVVTWDELGFYVRKKVPVTVQKLFGKDGGEQSPNTIENLQGAPAALIHFQDGGKTKATTTIARITAGGGFSTSPPIVERPTQVAPRLLVAPFNYSRAENARAVWAHYLQVPEERRNSLGMDFVLIPPGKFAMGGYETPDDLKRAFPEAQLAIYTRERPVHPVTISKPFFMARYEVTKGQFKKFVEATHYETSAERDSRGGWGYTGDPKHTFARSPHFSWRNWGVDQSDTSPVVDISWFDARAFYHWLNKTEGKKYRLPTEAQWEYACRAGTTMRYYNGNDPEGLTRIANVRDAATRRQLPGWKQNLRSSDGWPMTSPVGRFEPNNFGLYDMLGNASEWCFDWFDENYYVNSPTLDPTGPPTGRRRVLRGESWRATALDCRPARRLDATPAHADAATGFRLVCEP